LVFELVLAPRFSPAERRLVLVLARGVGFAAALFQFRPKGIKFPAQFTLLVIAFLPLSTENGLEAADLLDALVAPSADGFDLPLGVFQLPCQSLNFGSRVVEFPAGVLELLERCLSITLQALGFATSTVNIVPERCKLRGELRRSGFEPLSGVALNGLDTRQEFLDSRPRPTSLGLFPLAGRIVLVYGSVWRDP
jgi:hypothetical protein